MQVHVRGRAGEKASKMKRRKEDNPRWEKDNRSKIYKSVRRTHVGGEIVTDISIDGHVLEVVVDTAADISIVSERCFFENWQESDLLQQELVLNAAGEGQTFIARKSRPLKIVLGEASLVKSLWVAPITDTMLLGLDILREVGATIDIGTGEVFCKRGRVPKKSRRVKDDSVYLSESITIPPESGMVCQGWAHPAKDAGLFTLESASSLEFMVWRRPVV